MSLIYVKAEPKRLRDLGFDEKWLQDRINEDPYILGLGEQIAIRCDSCNAEYTARL